MWAVGPRQFRKGLLIGPLDEYWRKMEEKGAINGTILPSFFSSKRKSGRNRVVPTSCNNYSSVDEHFHKPSEWARSRDRQALLSKPRPPIKSTYAGRFQVFQIFVRSLRIVQCTLAQLSSIILVV
jgi:hypothetical protein